MKIIFFGSIGIAKRILEELILPTDTELLGVCCEKAINSWRDEESVYDYAIKRNIRVLELREIPALKPDLGISVRFNQIIKPEVINAFRLGIVNTHGGVLPEYRGSYCNINAILNGDKEYGVTLHYIQSGIDDGDIIDIKKINICKDDTGFDLYQVSERLCYEVIRDNIDSLMKGTNNKVTQQEYIEKGHLCKVYKRDETIRFKDLTNVEVENPQWIRIVKAFDSPYHEPAYIRVGDKKIYVRYRYEKSMG